MKANFELFGCNLAGLLLPERVPDVPTSSDDPLRCAAPRFAATADPTCFPVPYRCMALASAHKSPERTQQEVKASQSQINSPFFPSPSSITSSTPQPPLHQMRQHLQPLFQHAPPLMVLYTGLIVRDNPTSVGEYIGEYIAKRCVSQDKRTSL